MAQPCLTLEHVYPLSLPTTYSVPGYTPMHTVPPSTLAPPVGLFSRSGSNGSPMASPQGTWGILQSSRHITLTTRQVVPCVLASATCSRSTDVHSSYTIGEHGAFLLPGGRGVRSNVV